MRPAVPFSGRLRLEGELDHRCGGAECVRNPAADAAPAGRVAASRRRIFDDVKPARGDGVPR